METSCSYKPSASFFVADGNELKMLVEKKINVQTDSYLLVPISRILHQQIGMDVLVELYCVVFYRDNPTALDDGNLEKA